MATKTKTVTKKVNTTTNKLFNVVDTVKTTTAKVNTMAVNTTEDVIAETITMAEQWQGVASKALKGGFKLAANQQDMIFDTLEIAKGQFKTISKKSSALFSKN